jgi:peptidyl-prolyl cis-trans isomerase SurA
MRILVSAPVLSFVVAGALASALAAQQPAPQVTAKPGQPALLDGIVAVVGDQPITRVDLRERVVGRIQRKEVPEPATDSAAKELERSTLSDLIEEELLLQKAKDLKVEVTDADVTPTVDRQVAAIRANYTSETQYRGDLIKAGLGTPEEYRRFLIDQFRRQSTLDKTIRKLTDDGKIIPLTVSDAEVAAEFERTKPFLGPRPASVTFKQIVIAPKPTDAAKEVARVKAESLLAQIKSGADFDRLAKRESMDPVTKETGGDMGWLRRGDNLPEFDRWLFGGGAFLPALQPGQTSPVFETPYGYYIVRLDRVQTGEVRARDILIEPVIDTADVARTKVLADSVAKLLRSGVPFDTLAKKYHDYAGKEETSILTPWVRDSLPETYQKGFAGVKVGDIVDFRIAGSPQRPDVPKFVVAQLLTVDQGGERTLGEMKAAVRAELAQRGGIHRYVDSLRKQTYVSILLDAPVPGESKATP